MKILKMNVNFQTSNSQYLILVHLTGSLSESIDYSILYKLTMSKIFGTNCHIY